MTFLLALILSVYITALFSIQLSQNFLSFKTNNISVTICEHVTNKINIAKYVGWFNDDNLSWGYHVN